MGLKSQANLTHQGVAMMSNSSLKAIFLALCLLGLSGSALAQIDRLPTTQPGPHAAQVIGAPGYPTQNLFEVNFIAINGRNVSPREVLWLEPGTYELQVSIFADFARSRPTNLRRRQPAGYNTIELELEAGKQYHILARYHRTGEDAGNYSVILHRVEE
jgi:hypothetical protein